ncbi:MAG: 4'-phosphopantetheinyl transferase superfamily protein [Mediterranea sp.]|jgi:phosphopantetheinyl transferase|nr:4'-phosphopantetheinyl transferase superfamily protein [Mediterranea sp.]
MPLYLRDNTPLLSFGVWKIEETVEELLALLPPDRRNACLEEIGNFASPRRRKEWLSTRVLLNEMLRDNAGIAYTPEGKPYLADHARHISISHTKGYAAVALSDLVPVGIDIEAYGTRVCRVRDRFLRPDEQINPYRGDEVWSLLLHWSAKEAMFKCMEVPTPDFRKLRVFPFTPLAMGRLRLRAESHSGDTFAGQYIILPDAVLVYVAG